MQDDRHSANLAPLQAAAGTQLKLRAQSASLTDTSASVAALPVRAMATAVTKTIKAPFAPDASKVCYVESSFTNSRGKSMFYCALFPKRDSSANAPAKPVRGVVLFLHGIGEHSHRFTHVYEYLCAHNYGVIAYDMAAHGRSDCERDGVRGHSDQFQHFVDDTNRFVSVAKQQVFPQMLPSTQQSSESVPLLFMGISFGTLVGLHTVLSGVHRFSAIVLASPAVSVEFTIVLRVLSVFSKSLSWLTPTAKIVPGVNFAGMCVSCTLSSLYCSVLVLALQLL